MARSTRQAVMVSFTALLLVLTACSNSETSQPRSSEQETAELTTAENQAQPGSQKVEYLGEPITVTLDAAQEFDLPQGPAAATSIEFSITATAPGEIAWGTTAGGDQPTWSNEFTTDAVADAQLATTSTVADLVPAGPTTVFFTPDGEFAGTAIIRFANVTMVPFGVNEDGLTYGVDAAGETPDLIAVSANALEGGGVDGYVYAEEFDGQCPLYPEMPPSPEDTLTRQDECEAAYPDGWDVPVYESDGKTHIGTFHIGG